MRQRKYTLPRHTNLAKQSSRIGAFLIDLAIFIACTVAFFYGCFRLILNPVVKPYAIEFEKEQLNSGLCYQNPETGSIEVLPSNSTFEQYRDVLKYYYMNYLTGEVETPGTGSRLADEKVINDEGVEVSKKEYYTVSWFNLHVLQIRAVDPEQDKNCLFTYEKIGDEYDRTKIGIPKSNTEVKESDIRQYMQMAVRNAYENDFLKQNYVIDMSNKSNFIFALEFVLSAIVGSLITYVVFPLVFKQGRTVGKKVLKLALANSEGYEFNNKQLAMRIMPLVVVILSFLIPIWNDFFILLFIPLTIFLVSFALAMASPKKSSLHDFTARTIVVDDKTSLIFKDEYEEEEYLLNEDNLTQDDIQETEEGEEPEISYEK